MIRRQFCRELAATGAALVAAPFLRAASAVPLLRTVGADKAIDPVLETFPAPATTPVGPGALVNGNWIPTAGYRFKHHAGDWTSCPVVEVNEFGIWFVPDESLKVVVFQPYHSTFGKNREFEQGLVCDGRVYYPTGVVKKPVPLM